MYDNLKVKCKDDLYWASKNYDRKQIFTDQSLMSGDRDITREKLYICYPPYFEDEIYLEMLRILAYFKYNIGKGIIMAHSEVYFDDDFEPEVESLRTAAKSGNKEFYKHEKKMARTIGKYYRYLDVDNECVLETPTEVPYDQVDFELDFDLVFCLGNTF